MEVGGFSRQGVEPIEEASDALFQKRRCCFFFEMNSSPSPAVGLAWWQKIRVSQIPAGGSLWSRGVSLLMKIRELSEIVAGPRWKTFIRRFNRDRNRSGSGKHLNVQYDALSYSMNFDEGPGQNGRFDDEGEDGYFSRNFSSRYAKGSMQFGKEGVTFV
ncbi:uncharacterized protein [Primulina huaijiensis]|uniref:uncharacterized protein n=1 Tax=Primulina huaijiensis TaxID=1492673 RepID=UPI003CC75D19